MSALYQDDQPIRPIHIAVESIVKEHRPSRSLRLLRARYTLWLCCYLLVAAAAFYLLVRLVPVLDPIHVGGAFALLGALLYCTCVWCCCGEECNRIRVPAYQV